MVKTHSDEYPFHQYPVTYQVTANPTSRHEYMILQNYSSLLQTLYANNYPWIPTVL